MSPAKLERIVSVSSEDPAFPAENLLKNEYSDKKWKSKNRDEKQISVVIQLERAELITKVDIGNYGSAFIEVMVSRSINPDDFKVLIAASSLMTLQEAKLGTNLSSVRFFKEDDLVKDVSSEKWDRIKLICSQPYNKLIQYGLSFIVVHTNSTKEIENAPSPALELFKLKKEEGTSKAVGSLFAKRKDSAELNLTGTAAIRAASTSGVIEKKQQLPLPRSSDSKPPYNNSSDTFDDSEDQASALRKKTLNKHKNTEVNSKITKAKKENHNEAAGSSSVVRRKPATEGKDSSKNKPSKPRLEKPFNQLLQNVFFAISGFQNPLRGEIRSKAIAMGAKYRPDWDNTCTHLICAFTNTPKFNQVLGHGKIVRKEWVESCYDRRMRLPWRRFALHPPDKKPPESEEEICELIVRPPSPIDNRRRVSMSEGSGGDTEDEIERVLQRQAINNHSQNNSVNIKEETKTLENKIKDDASELSMTNRNQNKTSIFKTDDEDVNKNSENATFINQAFNYAFKEASPPKKKDLLPHLESKENKQLTKRKKIKLEDSSEESKLLKDDRSHIVDTKNGMKQTSNKNSPKNILLLASSAPFDPYDLDTEGEDEASNSKIWNLPVLPTFFEGLIFHVAEDISGEERTEVCRYVFAHKGTLVEEDDLNSNKELHLIISNSKTEAIKYKNKWPEVICVRPDWVWKAHDEDRIPPYSNFQL